MSVKKNKCEIPQHRILNHMFKADPFEWINKGNCTSENNHQYMLKNIRSDPFLWNNDRVSDDQQLCMLEELWAWKESQQLLLNSN